MQLCTPVKDVDPCMMVFTLVLPHLLSAFLVFDLYYLVVDMFSSE